MADHIKSTKWWEEPNDTLHLVLGAVYRRIRLENQWKRDADEKHAALYCGDEINLDESSRVEMTYQASRLPFNAVRSAVDTVRAKIGKHRPLPQVLPTRGNWKSQKKARKATQLIEGGFAKYKVFEKHAKQVLRDAEIFRRGAWFYVGVPNASKPYIHMERCHPWEIEWDDWDARYDDPCNIYRCRSVDRGSAKSTWGTGKGATGRMEAIDRGGFFDNTGTRDISTTVDRMHILEAWHRCDSWAEHQAGDVHKCTGKHVVICVGGLLVSEDMTGGFPFARLRYEDPISGGDGLSLVQQLEGFQFELNTMSEVVSEGMRNLSMTLITIPDGAAITEQQIRNGVSVLYYKPVGKPDVFQPNPVHPAIYQRQHDLVRDAMGDAGVSMMSAQSVDSQHEESGIARQARDDIESERFVVFGRAYETWCMDVARLYIDAVKSVAKRFGEYSVPVQVGNAVHEIKWADVDVDTYELRVFPTSMLPQQLSARLDRLSMMFDKGLVDRATFLRHLDAPDMQAELDMETADKLLIDEQIESILDAEEEKADGFVMPTVSPYVDLPWALRRAHQKLNRAELDGAPEWNKDLVRQYIETCVAQITKLRLGGQPSSPSSPTPETAGPPPEAAPPGAMPPPGLPPGAPPMPPDMGMPPGMPGVPQ